MRLLDLIVLDLRQRDVFLSFAHRPFPHEVLKARRGKDGHHADAVVSNVIDRDPRISRDEHSGASVHVSDRVSQMYPGSARLQIQDFVGTGMSMCMDCSSGGEVR